MHESSYIEAQKFLKTYLPDGGSVLDVGSLDVNGSVKELCHSYHYVGIDIVMGEGVDIVLGELEPYPFGSKFDVVISNSTFEHNMFFWFTFEQMVKAVKPLGYIYINTPSEGNYHHAPDCWRFQKDAYSALERWAIYKGLKARLVNQYFSEKTRWMDNIGIFRKI